MVEQFQAANVPDGGGGHVAGRGLGITWEPDTVDPVSGPQGTTPETVLAAVSQRLAFLGDTAAATTLDQLVASLTSSTTKPPPPPPS